MSTAATVAPQNPNQVTNPTQGKDGNAWHEFDILAAVVSRYISTKFTTFHTACFYYQCCLSIFPGTKMLHQRNPNLLSIVFLVIDVGILESVAFCAHAPLALIHSAGDVPRK